MNYGFKILYFNDKDVAEFGGGRGLFLDNFKQVEQKIIAEWVQGSYSLNKHGGTSHYFFKADCFAQFNYNGEGNPLGMALCNSERREIGTVSKGT